MQITHERRYRLCSGCTALLSSQWPPGARCDLWWNQCNTTSCSYVISNLADIWHVCSCIISYSGTSGHFAAHPSSRVKDSRCAPSALNHPPLLASAHRLHYSSLTDARDTHSARGWERFTQNFGFIATGGTCYWSHGNARHMHESGTCERLPGLVGDAGEKRSDDGTLWEEWTILLLWLPRGPGSPAALCDGQR